MTPIFSEVLRPTEFADLIQPSAMVQRLERMAEQRMPMNMLFYGRPGVGKTIGGSHSSEQARCRLL